MRFRSRKAIWWPLPACIVAQATPGRRWWWTKSRERLGRFNTVIFGTNAHTHSLGFMSKTLIKYKSILNPYWNWIYRMNLSICHISRYKCPPLNSKAWHLLPQGFSVRLLLGGDHVKTSGSVTTYHLPMKNAEFLEGKAFYNAICIYIYIYHISIWNTYFSNQYALSLRLQQLTACFCAKEDRMVKFVTSWRRCVNSALKAHNSGIFRVRTTCLLLWHWNVR